jgi:hypothetical protein
MYLDIHKLPDDGDLEAVRAAHAEDVKVQDAYHVCYHGYYYNRAAGTVSCVVELGGASDSPAEARGRARACGSVGEPGAVEGAERLVRVGARICGGARGLRLLRGKWLPFLPHHSSSHERSDDCPGDDEEDGTWPVEFERHLEEDGDGGGVHGDDGDPRPRRVDHGGSGRRDRTVTAPDGRAHGAQVGNANRREQDPEHGQDDEPDGGEGVRGAPAHAGHDEATDEDQAGAAVKHAEGDVHEAEPVAGVVERGGGAELFADAGIDHKRAHERDETHEVDDLDELVPGHSDYLEAVEFGSVIRRGRDALRKSQVGITGDRMRRWIVPLLCWPAALVTQRVDPVACRCPARVALATHVVTGRIVELARDSLVILSPASMPTVVRRADVRSVRVATRSYHPQGRAALAGALLGGIAGSLIGHAMTSSAHPVVYGDRNRDVAAGVGFISGALIGFAVGYGMGGRITVHHWEDALLPQGR